MSDLRYTHSVIFLPFILFIGIACQPKDPSADDSASTANQIAEASLRSTQQEAAFVGDASCSSCHAEITEAYAQTNHKRGFMRFNAEEAIERFDVERAVYNEARNLHYEVYLDGDTLYQREYREDLNGDLVHELIHPADYVIGSGNATRSYLMENNGFVTEMPVTWYVERGYWEMSPGYQEANDRFSRKIILDCLTCHNDAPAHSPSTQNHFADIPLGISCERCHGPASLHVEYWEEHKDGEAPDEANIVNPASLDRGRQMSNCQQCHLAGISVYEPGEDPTTFHSGQELNENRTVFVPEQHLVDPDWVGIDSHPLRLARSACYENTDMTCNTCHDPHRSKAQLPENYYNDRCLSCHSGESGSASSHSCTRPGVESVEMASAGDCISCHMQKGGTSDVPHVSFSDHWIRKDPGPPRDPDEAKTAFETFDPITLVALQKNGISGHELVAQAPETPQEYLETAIAYFTFYEQMHRLPEYLPLIVSHARQGFAGGADHVEARIAVARALATLDSTDAALGHLQRAVVAYPKDAWVPFWIGTIQLENGQIDAAIGSLQRAVSLQPNLIEAQVKLGESLLRAERLEEAKLQLEDVVQREPLHEPRSWYNLGLVYLQLKSFIDAEHALSEASRLDPNLIDAHIQLGSLFLSQKRLDAAEKAFRSAIAADENNPAGYGSLATVFLQRGDTQRARQLLETVLRLDPGNAAATGLLRRIGG